MWRQGKYNMKYEVQNILCKIIFQDDRRRFGITEEKYKTCICQKKNLDEKEDLWSEALKIDKHCTIIGGLDILCPLILVFIYFRNDFVCGSLKDISTFCGERENLTEI